MTNLWFLLFLKIFGGDETGQRRRRGRGTGGGGGRFRPSWRGSVSSVALDAIVEQDGHGQDIELLHMCPQGSEWAVLQGASRLLHAGRIRHILFGKMLEKSISRPSMNSGYSDARHPHWLVSAVFR